MAKLAESAACLRIAGENLDPDEITKILRGSPTSIQRKGDTVTSKTSGSTRTVKVTMWRLQAEDRRPGDLDAQISEIFNQLSGKIADWNTVGSRCEMDLFCGLFMEDTNEGLPISVDSLYELCKRGVRLDFDIYGVIPDSSRTEGAA